MDKPKEYPHPFWKTDDEQEQKRPCLVEEFFKKQLELPPNKRKNYCHISCPCDRCNPYFLGAWR